MAAPLHPTLYTGLDLHKRTVFALTVGADGNELARERLHVGGVSGRTGRESPYAGERLRRVWPATL